MKRIFLCSTFDDLEKHRSEVLLALHSLQQIVEAMEYWGSRPDTPLEMSLERVKLSDIFVCILGSKYGELTKYGTSISYEEYKVALQNKLDIFSYIIDENNHLVLIKDVETGEKALKLNEFKELAKEKMKNVFCSPEDLARKVITDIILHLDDKGANISTALKNSGYSSISAWAGYSYGFSKHNVDFSKVLLKEGEGFTISTPIASHVLSSAYILECMFKGDYSFLDDMVTLHQNTYDIIRAFSSKLNFDYKILSTELLNCRDSVKLRMLIVLAELSRSNECVEAICIQTLYRGNAHRNNLYKTRMQVNSYYDVVRNALEVMDCSSLETLQSYLEKAKKMKRWQAKRQFERAVKRLNKICRKNRKKFNNVR